jgi:acetyl-CoA C-acetyltransferase/acetyl-CoA acyltransferase
MHEYGTTAAQLAEVAVKNHYHGSLNDRAHFGKQCTVEEVQQSPTIAEPFRLKDCCPFTDGASAVIVSNTDLGDSFDNEPVEVLGIGHSTDAVPLAEKTTLAQSISTKKAAIQAYEQAGLGPEDIDGAEVHDCFTGAEIIAIEGLGLVEEGTAGEVTEARETYVDGKIPVNPSGGLKAKGHPIGATGTAQIVEMTEQIRGIAGDRQIDDVKTAATQNLGGVASTTLVTILGKAA